MGSTPDVLLISMPWASLTEPSLGLAILKAKLLDAGIRCRVRHQNLFALEYFTSESYDAVGERWGVNDFLFTQPFEAEIAPDQREALRAVALNTYRLRLFEVAAAGVGPTPY